MAHVEGFQCHIWHGDTLIYKFLPCPPNVGDTLRFNESTFATVTEVVWCLDEPTTVGQRINIRCEPLKE